MTSDQQQVRRAATRVGLAVGVAGAVIVALITFALVAYVVSQSRVEGGRLPGDGRGPRGPGSRGEWSMRIINVGEIIPILLFLALLGVLLLAAIAWFAARSATKPLTEALRVQRNFIADASHELRTPLTTLNSRIQLAQHRLDRGGDVRGVLVDLRQDATAMEQILGDLLLAAENSSVEAAPPAPVDVALAATEAARLTSGLAETAGVTIEIEVPQPTFVLAAPTALIRALVILLDNATGHSKSGSTVWVRATRSRGKVEIRVVDEGEGITGASPEQVFERFSRGDSNRRGFGLGLSLVRDIAERFGGHVTVENTGAAGTTLLLVMPAAGSV